MLSLFKNHFSDRNNDFCQYLYLNYHTLFFKFSITAMCLIVCTDLITIYDIIIFNIEVFNWII